MPVKDIFVFARKLHFHEVFQTNMNMRCDMMWRIVTVKIICVISLPTPSGATIRLQLHCYTALYSLLPRTVQMVLKWQFSVARRARPLMRTVFTHSGDHSLGWSSMLSRKQWISTRRLWKSFLAWWQRNQIRFGKYWILNTRSKYWILDVWRFLYNSSIAWKLLIYFAAVTLCVVNSVP